MVNPVYVAPESLDEKDEPNKIEDDEEVFVNNEEKAADEDVI